MAGQVPSIARNVHYVAYGTPGGEFPAGAHRAAIITGVSDGSLAGSDPLTQVHLCVLNPTGFQFVLAANYDSTGTQPGTWHWPEYVPAKG